MGLSWWQEKSGQVHCREQETIAIVLAIRTVNLKCYDCSAEQKAFKDFSNFLKTQNLSDVESFRQGWGGGICGQLLSWVHKE